MEMYEITAGEHTAFTILALNFRGTPVGVDVRKVMRSGLTPRLNTGIAHREPGLGMVGAGLVQAPTGCFAAAFEALRALYGSVKVLLPALAGLRPSQRRNLFFYDS